MLFKTLHASTELQLKAADTRDTEHGKCPPAASLQMQGQFLGSAKRVLRLRFPQLKCKYVSISLRHYNLPKE